MSRLATLTHSQSALVHLGQWSTHLAWPPMQQSPEPAAASATSSGSITANIASAQSKPIPQGRWPKSKHRFQLSRHVALDQEARDQDPSQPARVGLVPNTAHDEQLATASGPQPAVRSSINEGGISAGSSSNSTSDDLLRPAAHVHDLRQTRPAQLSTVSAVPPAAPSFPEPQHYTNAEMPRTDQSKGREISCGECDNCALQSRIVGLYAARDTLLPGPATVPGPSADNVYVRRARSAIRHPSLLQILEEFPCSQGGSSSASHPVSVLNVPAKPRAYINRSATRTHEERLHTHVLRPLPSRPSGRVLVDGRVLPFVHATPFYSPRELQFVRGSPRAVPNGPLVSPKQEELDVDPTASYAAASFDCPICLESSPEAGAVVIDTCGHKYCPECLKGHISTSLGDSKLPICPECQSTREGTPGVVSRKLAEAVGLTAAQSERWTEIELLAFSVVVECHGCHHSMHVDRDEFAKEKIITCPLPRCRYSWCKSCNVQVPFGTTHNCDGVAELENLMRRRGWKPCPGCHTNTEKQVGCNHMTCTAPGCQTHWCYMCGSMIARAPKGRELVAALDRHYKADCRMFAPVTGS